MLFLLFICTSPDPAAAARGSGGAAVDTRVLHPTSPPTCRVLTATSRAVPHGSAIPKSSPPAAGCWKHYCGIPAPGRGSGQPHPAASGLREAVALGSLHRSRVERENPWIRWHRLRCERRARLCWRVQGSQIAAVQSWEAQQHNGRSFAFDFRHLGLVFAVRSTRSLHGQKYWYFSSLPEYPDNPSPLNLILENFVGILYL